MNTNKNTLTRKKYTLADMVLLAIFIAIVFVTQMFLGTLVNIGGVNIAVVLIPIVVGGILLGPLAGGILGLTFGVVVIYAGLILNPASLTALFVGYSAGSAVTVITAWLLRGFATGFVATLIYKALAKKSEFLGVILAAGAAPIINTGLFVITLLILSNTFLPAGETFFQHLYRIVIMMIGVNFLIEFFASVILTPAMYHFIAAAKKEFGKVSGK